MDGGRGQLVKVLQYVVVPVVVLDGVCSRVVVRGGGGGGGGGGGDRYDHGRREEQQDVVAGVDWVLL